jgi:hypothetical protein
MAASEGVTPASRFARTPSQTCREPGSARRPSGVGQSLIPSRARAREGLVDTLKWRASKMKPRNYGDKLQLEAEVSVRQMTDEQLNARLTQLLERRRETPPE